MKSYHYLIVVVALAGACSTLTPLPEPAATAIVMDGAASHPEEMEISAQPVTIIADEPGLALPDDGAGSEEQPEPPDSDVMPVPPTVAIVDEPGFSVPGKDVESAADLEAADVASREMPVPDGQDSYHEAVARLCAEIGNKLGSVSRIECDGMQLSYSGAHSVHDRPLLMRDYLARDNLEPELRILIMGGIHGDEYSSISILFKWMAQLEMGNPGAFHWRVVPLANPDGLLDAKAVRQNANGVDLNRNFPSADWHRYAQKNWKEETGSNPRRFPGHDAGSEPEVKWLVEQIATFQPDIIVSVHAPYHLLDFDGPATAPEKIGELYLHQLGVYPGSLGNYAGIDKGIPVVTLELPSAGIMPEAEQIRTMWTDLVQWLHQHASNRSS
ncbi:MAG: M14 family zinc carboxypeptidase [Pseudomonadales bacterium]|nr:M14 family zinc carboxypeptidase [Pseudomonadales bacterium]